MAFSCCSSRHLLRSAALFEDRLILSHLKCLHGTNKVFDKSDKDFHARGYPKASTPNQDEYHGNDHVFSDTKHRATNSDHLDYQKHKPIHDESGKSSDPHVALYAAGSTVSLHGVMQSNVPHPFQPSEKMNPTHRNMPGGGKVTLDKYVMSERMNVQKKKLHQWAAPGTVMEGIQGPADGVTLRNDDLPDPQGVQGAGCSTFALWLDTCQLHHCDEAGLHEQTEGAGGRRTLVHIFKEQEAEIRQVGLQRRRYSTSQDQSEDEQPRAEAPMMTSPVTLTTKERFQQGIRDYGSTLVVFHIGMSLTSLGLCYAAISNGVDMRALLEVVGLAGNERLASLATGASTFAVAYAVHKCLMPVRLGITFACVPILVRQMRKQGWIKTPPSS